MPLINFSQIKQRLRPKIVALLRRTKLLPLAKIVYGWIAPLLPPPPAIPKGPLASRLLMQEVHLVLDKDEPTKSIIFLPKP